LPGSIFQGFGEIFFFERNAAGEATRTFFKKIIRTQI
jgi:hypothetical protein